MNKDFPTDFVSQLCPNCGLCCNGVLFVDGELQKSDDTRRLAELGLSLKQKGRKTAFTQPCACFDGKFCRIYTDRPMYCRVFECGLLKRVQDGDLDVKTALGRISEARRLVDQVSSLLGRGGDNDERTALLLRYTRAMGRPIDLSNGPGTGKLRGKLLLAVNRLMELLRRSFLS